MLGCLAWLNEIVTAPCGFCGPPSPAVPPTRLCTSIRLRLCSRRREGLSGYRCRALAPPIACGITISRAGGRCCTCTRGDQPSSPGSVMLASTPRHPAAVPSRTPACVVVNLSHWAPATVREAGAQLGRVGVCEPAQYATTRPVRVEPHPVAWAQPRLVTLTEATGCRSSRAGACDCLPNFSWPPTSASRRQSYRFIVRQASSLCGCERLALAGASLPNRGRLRTVDL